MRILLTFFLLLSLLSTRAQDTTQKIDNDKTFTKVEIEPAYPGGPSAWMRFLNKNLHYPDDAVNNNIQGDIMVQFVVDKEGKVSDIQAISGPNKGGLREEAVRMIQHSGIWTPAVQNGRWVRAYKKQIISFKMVSS